MFVFTISHPWFWPSYWGYDTEEWFNYSREIAIEGPFRITLDTTDKTTTHFHRPLAQYASALVAAGFVIDLIAEPLPSASVARRYPQQWKVPRILAVRCVAGR